MNKLDELKKLAQNATAGLWPNLNDPDIRDACWRQYDWDKCRENRTPVAIPDSDSKYIAAACPDVVLKLIAVARAASMPSIRDHWETANLNNDEAYQLELELEDLQIALDKLLGEPTNYV